MTTGQENVSVRNSENETTSAIEDGGEGVRESALAGGLFPFSEGGYPAEYSAAKDLIALQHRTSPLSSWRLGRGLGTFPTSP